MKEKQRIKTEQDERERKAATKVTWMLHTLGKSTISITFCTAASMVERNDGA